MTAKHSPQTPANDDLAPLCCTLEDTGRVLGKISTRTIQRLIERGEIEAIGRGKLKRVLYASIVAYIERERSKGAA